MARDVRAHNCAAEQRTLLQPAAPYVYSSSMFAIAIIFRALPPLDRDRLREILLSALAATGSDSSNRQSEAFDNGEMGYHFVVWGDDSLDCHVYSQLLLSSFGEAKSEPARHLCEQFKMDWTTFIVESSPLAPAHDVSAYRRVCLAVAALLDSDAVAIVDERTHRLALVTSQTSDLLRSPLPAAAFADGVALDAP